MVNIAIVEAKPSKNDYYSLFDGEVEFEQFQLCSDNSKKRILKKDVDIDFNSDNFDWVILVGSEPLKYYTPVTSITEYSGRCVEEKFLPIINPAMLSFKPESRPLWEESKNSILSYIKGEKEDVTSFDSLVRGIDNTEELKVFLKEAIEYPDDYIALDSETSDLYPRNGYMLGFSLCFNGETGAYINSECIDEECELLMQQLFDKKIVIFWNCKFDIAWFEFHFGFSFPRYEDAMLLHYLLDENSPHGLKPNTMKYTPYGDYEKDLYVWIDKYKKANGLRKADFNWSFIPFDKMVPYASMDALCTRILFEKFKVLFKNPKLTFVYQNLLLKGTRFLIDVQDNGVPFCEDRLALADSIMQEQIDNAIEELYQDPRISEFEKIQGKEFNPNSVMQLRSLLFDHLGLNPTGKKTGTGADSTDAEVLKELSSESHIPGLILDIRQKSKIKNTYLDKISTQLDRDMRLRTNFNLHTTSSGRLSSSGKLNMQQLPRDNPAVKGCIKARKGWKIVAIDLTTAEVYIAAVLSGDEALMDVFRQGGNFHSAIAKKVFKLPCAVEDVVTLYPMERQAAKAVSFGIMYGAGPHKIAQEVTKSSGTRFTVQAATEVIDEYFASFPQLKSWIDESKKFILANGFVYSSFGRKRRLPNVKSTDSGIKGHEVRSGLNFLVQSTASDVNLLAGIDMNEYIKRNNMKSKIFALVHDSILAEVPDSEIEEYQNKIIEFIQQDRGVSIPGCPIGYDIEIGEDYSMGKFEKMYGHYAKAA